MTLRNKPWLALSSALGGLCVALLPIISAAAPPPATPADRPPPGHARSLAVPQIAAPPVIDGQLDDSPWQGAATAGDFWISAEERWPGEDTEVLVMADGKQLYVGFRVYDSQPERIGALQTRRDVGLGLDDRVTVELDPYRLFTGDSRFTFSVNARGTQQSEIGSGRARQLAWRGDWRAAAARTAYGWSAEMAIPFAILNFQGDTETFAANFYRYHQRTRETSQWADTTPQGLREYAGRLTNLQLPAAGKPQPWTFMPYLFIGKDVPDRDGEIQGTLGNAGLDLRYEPRANLTGLFSLNPDFSQVERAVTDINFSYNEKALTDLRPFFMEGAGFFDDNRSRYFYSNRIPDFDYGGKLFGRLGTTRFGGFFADSPDGRYDLMAQVAHQHHQTHSLGGVLVGSGRPDLQNLLYALRADGRFPSGLSYAVDGARTATTEASGDGSFVQGQLGWQENFWSVKLTGDRYSREFFPANGLLAGDLPDTRGGTAAAGYYRDFGSGPLLNLQGTLFHDQRYTGDGELQKRYTGGSGKLELRQEISLEAGYNGGRYRAVGDTPGSWQEELFNDHYWYATLGFNTRSSRLLYGATWMDGTQAGEDYRYTSAYLKTRPTATTRLDLTAEQLSLDGTYDQLVVNGSWDLTPDHQLAGRYIASDYGDSLRLALSSRLRHNLDLFIVYDWQEEVPYQLSAKLVMTFH